MYKKTRLDKLITKRKMGLITVPNIKKCHCCGIDKPINQFYKNKRVVDGYSTLCKVCANEKHKNYSPMYYQNNKEHITKIAREWKIKDRKNNPEKYRMQYRLYKDRNKDKLKEKSRCAQEMRRMAGKSINNKEWEQIKEDYFYRCAYCNEKKPLVKDHIVPVSRGGTNDYRNIVPACKECNGKKGDKSLLRFMYGRKEVLNVLP